MLSSQEEFDHVLDLEDQKHKAQVVCSRMQKQLRIYSSKNKYFKRGTWLKLSEKGMLEWLSSREVVGEKVDMEKEAEEMQKREEEIKWCRHGV